jgi:hypothetical protein
VGGFLGQGERHPAAAAAGIEDLAGEGDPALIEPRQDLGAPEVFEERVVVFGSEPAIGVRLDGGGIDASH